MIRNIFLLGTLIFLFFGCSSSNQPSIKSSNKTSLAKSDIKYFNLSILKSPFIVDSNGYKITANELKKELKSSLKKYYPNAIIDLSSNSKKGINIHLEVIDFAYVSGAKRFLIGSFGGNARLNIDIKFKDTENNKILLEDNFTSSSSKWAGVFGATTSRQIKTAVEYIVKKVNNIKI